MATPIGNLEDITYRAVRVLGGVDRIACEDTRITRRLLERYGIDKPLMRHEAHNEAASTEGILQLLESGESVALVSDAGTPCINDPGQRLIAAALDADHPVVPIPGPSSVLTAVSASGLPMERFTFHGFVPKKARERTGLFTTLPYGTHVFFCPARDLEEVVGALAEASPDAPTVVAREMTKVHETWYRGAAAEVVDQIREGDGAERGEAVLLVHRPPSSDEVTDRDIARALAPLLRGGVRKKEASKEVANKLDVSKRRVYQIAVRM
ncbi:MAG: 16S rRNA (cytidine(1402)-2'-O)-methyltransferase [Myxococcota bacterium]